MKRHALVRRFDAVALPKCQISELFHTHARIPKHWQAPCFLCMIHTIITLILSNISVLPMTSGGVESSCLAVNGSGHVGTLCASCLPGYAYPTVNGFFPPTCKSCGNIGLNFVAFAMHWAAVSTVIIGIYAYFISHVL